MNLEQVKTFRLAAELGSFSRAADEQFLSQPAVSLQIRQLERELNVTLFERNGRRITLTTAGRVFLEYARQMEAMRSGLQLDLQNLDAEATAVSIGCSSTSARYYMPAFLAELRSHAPEVYVRVSIVPPDQAIASLAKGELDFILTTEAFVSSRIKAEECLRSRLFVIGPAGHPLTRAARVAAEELEPYPFALLPSPWIGPGMFRRWAAEHGVKIRVVMEIGGYDGLKEAVREGVGLSLISETALVQDLKDSKIGLVRVVGLPLEFPVLVAHRAGQQLSAAATTFQAVILGGRWRDRLPRLDDVTLGDRMRR